ncbi:sulfite exporter TauE/SafE family protein [Empedobacter stercoris]|uniref:sulfite exporter TauE/SafE family protein n=1 Tax=Empedobacter stercoris TaxID=1628248 RepID=UPI001DC07597|nr:sulfite exporter TauE/SafE family protein [Empedobacter stercoris]UWX66958.1 sulfite exporter TauE/SafE family protein [Empedobacter stercoris]HJD87241.1 sulfite exporter TauE/SafE family protein [Empedobacter falsenii]
MDFIEFFGFVGAFFIGLIMGVLGGGGSILAVPILAYIFHFDERIATAYSLCIVGSTGLVGGIKQASKKMVDWKVVYQFGVPAVIGITLVRAFLIPALPSNLFSIGDFIVTRRMAMFGLFAFLMIFAAVSMLKGKKETEIVQRDEKLNPVLLIQGFLIGGLTGMVGAGGGFLIVPALMMVAKLDMKKASATSLVIIAINSLIGFFIGDAFHIKINWEFLSVFIGISMAGIFVGTYINKFLPVQFLKRTFAIFIILMAVFMFIEEFIIQ